MIKSIMEEFKFKKTIIFTPNIKVAYHDFRFRISSLSGQKSKLQRLKLKLQSKANY